MSSLLSPSRQLLGRHSVTTRLSLGFGLIVLMLCAVAALGWSALQTSQTDLGRMVQANNARLQQAQTLLGQAGGDAGRDQLRELAREMSRTNSEALVQAQQQADRQLWWVIGMIGASTALAVLLAGWLIRGIRSPMRQTIEVAERIARGDLTEQLPDYDDAEFGRLQQAIGGMQDRLRTMVGSLRETTDSISTASTQIAAGNANLSSRTEQTSGSLQQTASSMEQLSGTVRETASSARTANELVQSAVTAAQRGGEVVAQVVHNMEDISASSRKISEIIAVIDGIAFQTNILALNAAVEAARAGEQGRGFAVVAGEVRNLAQRAASAAKEIKTLINTSVEKVESGGKLVRDAGATMEAIVSSVQSVTEIIGKISTATGEQSEGLSQVNQSVAHLDHMTQQNAVLVDESASAAESLRQQAERLQKVVGAFRLLQQTQEATWTAHTAISDARERARQAPSAGAPAPSAPPPAPPRGSDSGPARGSDDWENF
ncbi:methyl-accepting chemotaxis protein [Sphaerotilus hippei]|uniref:Methyl-accepting chemotaxis protein n=1 Tax=Sphaerotilus hippei TaxID=744406 RepID=A0A318H4B5_9BURK|nr:methyl-accepting chemotaxis protein [Sphaerotilus hippei]PXW98536.1 methyl-accepting chemotaxis protein [Sphaerotilus hippei]